jgi:hypothetical protein
VPTTKAFGKRKGRYAGLLQAITVGVDVVLRFLPIQFPSKQRDFYSSRGPGVFLLICPSPVILLAF